MVFDTTDIVELAGYEELFRVTGVIHDDERLFVTGMSGKEFEVPFSDVYDRWAYKALIIEE